MGTLRMCCEFANFSLMGTKSYPLRPMYNSLLPTNGRFITVGYTLLVLRFFMCNARALKAGVAASNVALKPNAEHLEHN